MSRVYLRRWLESRGIGSRRDIEVGVAMVLTREGTGMASAEGSPEIDGNKKNLIEGHFGEAMEARTDGAEDEGRSCRSASFCHAKEAFLLLGCLRINMKLQGCGGEG